MTCRVARALPGNRDNRVNKHKACETIGAIIAVLYCWYQRSESRKPIEIGRMSVSGVQNLPHLRASKSVVQGHMTGWITVNCFLIRVHQFELVLLTPENPAFSRPIHETSTEENCPHWIVGSETVDLNTIEMAFMLQANISERKTVKSECRNT